VKLKLLTIGEKMPSWVEQGVEEYKKRLPADMGFELLRLPMSKRTKNKNAAIYKQEEAKTLTAAADKCNRVIALDVKGKAMTTELLVKKLTSWRQEGDSVALIIGGPDGIDAPLLQKADEKWSLSGMTMPHPIAQLVLVEQIYRAWSVTQGHPYHRA